MGEVITAKDKEYEAEERATAPGANQSMSDRVNNRSLRPQSAAFKEFMKSGWADDDPEIKPLESSKFTPARLEALGKAFPGERLVIPAGQPKVRNNDCDYMFRPDTTFAYYTGLGSDYEAGAVRVRVVSETDPEITSMVESIREANGFADPDKNSASDDKLHEFAAEARMVKDGYEINEMRKAVDATKHGFDRLLSALPAALDKPRSERILEGAFNAVSRELGNAIGYDSIVASGPHAPILHWMRNTGVVKTGDMLLVDAGVEVDSLYTADITRTFPTNGKFTDFQKRLYQAVLDSQQAGFEAAKPGATYSDIHHACMRVIAERLHDWGLLPVSVEESLSPQGQQHRRWLACGVAHHLGLDVHDCAQARFESYQGAPIRPGMIFTIEPGLYFREDDLLIPPEYRGIGIRIEDDVLMTENGPEWISAGIPKQIDDVEAWMAEQAAQAK